MPNHSLSTYYSFQKRSRTVTSVSSHNKAIQIVGKTIVCYIVLFSIQDLKHKGVIISQGISSTFFVSVFFTDLNTTILESDFENINFISLYVPYYVEL